MKKLYFLLSLLMILLSFGGCSKTPEVTQPDISDAIPTETPVEESTEVTIPTLDGPKVKTTLMIYMIGSDLESKAGAASADLEEIAASGIDAQHNVLVYAGGAKAWHGALDGMENCTLLELTEGGFSAIETREETSMGQPENLTEFLQFGYEQYPAEQYALILWNHGNGPVMGYGKDEAHGGDALLLEEMAQALAASPFGKDNKLNWVGFDACLMASAELAFVWADYANYMVSSQEVEPSFGWNYGFLRNLGLQDTPALMNCITDSYMQTCEAYYIERNYSHRDTTLSCVDLSAVSELEQAINNLFIKATADVSKQYNLLTVRRVQTRALGRASTGSEYDLIDLKDMALQLQELYPEESAALQQAVAKMVIINNTNTELCSGMSLYYPFHNKQYYERSWHEIYSRLGIFPEYQKYLETYGEIWQQNDQIKQLAAAVTPKAGEDGTYYLPLTAQQAESFVSAKYYILQRKGEDVYICPFVSNDVTNVNGVLVANFDGNIIYAKNDYGKYIIPTIEEHDRIGDLARYSVPVVFSNSPLNFAYRPEDFESRMEGFRYHLTVDRSTQEISVSALLPRDQNPEPDTIFTGKTEDADLSQWHTASFVDPTQRYPTRDENGVLLPLAQWHTNTVLTIYEAYLYQGLEFVYEPLDGGEYFLMIEAQDTQGNSFCSEMLPITVPERERPKATLPQTQVQWDSGSHILLAKENGVELYATVVDVCGLQRYTLELRNHNDFPVYITANNLILNGNTFAKDYWSSCSALPGQTIWITDDTYLASAEEAGFLPELTALQFDVEILNTLTSRPVITPQRFSVQLGDQLSADYAKANGQIQPTVYPTFMGARAEKQVLYADDDIQITLLGCGANDSYAPDLAGWLCVENRKEFDITVQLSGAALNQIYTPESGLGKIPAHNTGYIPFEINDYALGKHGFTGMYQMSLLLKIYEHKVAYTDFGKEIWCDVKLAESAPVEDSFREGSVVIWEKEGIRLALDRPTEGSTGKTEWRVTMYNGSQRSVSIRLIDTYVNGQLQNPQDNPVYLSLQAGPDQYAVGNLTCSIPMNELNKLSFCIQVQSRDGEAVLFTDTESITITDIIWPEEVVE